MKVYRIEFERKALYEIYVEAPTEEAAKAIFENEEYEDFDAYQLDVMQEEFIDIDYIGEVDA